MHARRFWLPILISRLGFLPVRRCAGATGQHEALQRRHAGVGRGQQRIEALADAINVRRSTPVHLVHAVSEVAAAVAAVARDGDLVLTLGAGSIGGVAPAAVAALAARDAH